MEQTKTIKTETGELYVQGDTIVGRMVIEGNVTKWLKGDKLHRDGDLPACVGRNEAGVVTYEVYYRDGKQHRDGDLPAYIRRNDAGNIILETYYMNGKIHRVDNSARIYFNDAGAVIREEYWIDNNIHRKNGPAIIEKDDNGKVVRKIYYNNGIRWADQTINKAKASSEKLTEDLAAAKAEVATAINNAELAAANAEADAERAKNAELQAQVTALTEKINKIKALLG